MLKQLALAQCKRLFKNRKGTTLSPLFVICIGSVMFLRNEMCYCEKPDIFAYILGLKFIIASTSDAL